MRGEVVIDLMGASAVPEFLLESLRRPIEKFPVALEHCVPQDQRPVIKQRNRPSQGRNVERAFA